MIRASHHDTFIIGTMRWGSWGAQFSAEQAAGLLTDLYQKGFTAFDLADIYGSYTTEKLFGDALKLSGIPRNQLVLITKCGIQYPGGDAPHKVKSYNTGSAYIQQQVNRSLENLQTDYLDMLLIHRPDPLLNPAELATTITTLKDKGTLRAFGVSNFNTTEFTWLNQHIKLENNQVFYALTHPTAAFDGSLQQSITQKFRPQIWSPLGDYFTGEAEHVLRLKPLVQQLAKKYSVTETALLLAWVRMHPSQPVPVLGSTKMERLEESLLALDIELELEDWYHLLEASRGHRVA
jgi:predicted oxidoreductase